MDKKRGEAFSKLAREILTALRTGSDVALRSAIDRAREANMPKENIERLLQSFEEKRANLQTFWLEGFGPGGIVMMIEVESDNKNRILTEIKLIMREYGGSLGEEGSVRFLFERLVEVEIEGMTDDKQLELIDEGAKEIVGNTAYFEVGKREGKLVMKPKTLVKVDNAGETNALVEALEENNEVVNVYTNLAGES